MKIVGMDSAWLWFHLPRIAYAAAGAGLICLLYRRQRAHDFSSRLARLRNSAVKATVDAVYRSAELADAEARLAAASDADRQVFVVTPWFEIYFAQAPKFVLWAFVAGAGLLYLSFFHSSPADYWNWFSWFGLALLGLALGIHLGTGRLRGSFEQVWQLNRKYLMLKAAGVSELDASLEIHSRIMEYYPDRPELLLEKAGRLADAGRLAAAVSEVRNARAIRPGEANYAFLEASFLIRNGENREAGKLLGTIERDFSLAATDPRAAVYRAAMELGERRGDAARKNLGDALRLDGAFVRKFLKSDPALAGLRDLLPGETGPGEI